MWPGCGRFAYRPVAILHAYYHHLIYAVPLAAQNRRSEALQCSRPQDPSRDRLSRVGDHSGEVQLGPHSNRQPAETAGHLSISLDRVKCPSDD
jgi:hypothetical protein